MQDYKDYILSEAHTDEYDAFLICLNYEGILSYLDAIEDEDQIKNSKGRVLIDQLLVTGNGKNRYLLCDFDHGSLDLENAVIEKPEESYRSRASKILKDHNHLLDNTILTDLEREHIINEVSF